MNTKMSASVSRALGLLLALAAGCSKQTPVSPSGTGNAAVAPGDPSSPATTWSVSGTVWEYGPAGATPATGGTFFAYVTASGSGRSQGPMTIGKDGRYRFSVPTTTTRVSVFGRPGSQPCATSVATSGDTSADVHHVIDPALLGGHLPDALRANSPTLSGVVYEETPQGRRPVADAWVVLDGLDNLGVVIADTRTDADGRYILCNVPQVPGTALGIAGSGFILRELTFAEIVGRTTLDIELRRPGGGGGGGGGATWTVSGTMLLYGPSGVSPASGGDLFAWVQNSTGGQSLGPVKVAADGRYQFTVPVTTTRVSAFGGPGHQPCAAAFAPTGNTIADVHRVIDPSQLGGNLPAALRARPPTLSGVVYEQTSQGRQPIAGAWVVLDGAGNMGVVTADTVTDADGRYTLCGVPQVPETSMSASKSGFELRDVWSADILGRATLDIELRRSGLLVR